MSLLLETLPSTASEAQSETNASLERQVAMALRTAGYIRPGSVDNGHIGTGGISVSTLYGQLIAGNNATIGVGALIGTLTTGDNARINVGTLAGTLIATHAASVEVGALEGTLDASHAARVNVGSMTGTLDASHAAEVNVTALTGTLNTGDGANVNVGALTGTLNTGHSARITMATLNGTLTSADPARVAASAITAASLSALSANIGTLTMEPGGVIRSAASPSPRFEITSGSIKAYTDATNVTFAVDGSSGKVTTLAGIGGPNSVANASFEDGVNSMTSWLTYLCSAVGSTATAKFGATSSLVTKNESTSPIFMLYQDTPRRAVRADEAVTASAYILQGSNWSPVRVGVRCYNAAGTHLGDLYGSTVHENTMAAWTRISGSFDTLITNTASVSAIIHWDSTGHPSNGLNGSRYVDGVQIESGLLLTGYGAKPDEILQNAVTDLQLAPSAVKGGGGTGKVHIVPGTIIAADIVSETIGTGQLAANAIVSAKIAADQVTAREFNALPGGTNRLDNVLFIDGASGYTLTDHGTGPVTTYTDPTWPGGTHGIYWTAPGGGGSPYMTTQYVAATAALNWMASCFYYGTNGRSVTFQLQWFNSSFTYLSATAAIGGTVDSAKWKRIEVGGVAPAGTAYARFVLQFHSCGANELCYASGPQIEYGDVVSAFSYATDNGVFTGGTFRTSATNPKVQMDATGLTKTDSSGYETVQIGQTDGLDLLATENGTSPTDRRVQWFRQSGGTLCGELVSGTNAPYGETIMRGYSTGGASSMLYCGAGSSVQQVGVAAGAGGGPFIILDSTNFSDFETGLSDERLKRSIRPLTAVHPDPLATLAKLETKAFRWAENEGPVGQCLGFTAQQTAPVVPEAVSVSGDGDRMAVRHAPLIALLVEGVKDLADRVKQLEGQTP